MHIVFVIITDHISCDAKAFGSFNILLGTNTWGVPFTWHVGIVKTNCLLQIKHLFSYSIGELIMCSISMYLFCNYFIFLSVISLPTALCLCFCVCNFDIFSSRYVRWEGISVKSFVCIFVLCYSCTQVTLSYILSCTFTFTLTWLSLSVHFLKIVLNFEVVKQHCWSAFKFFFSVYQSYLPCHL